MSSPWYQSATTDESQILSSRVRLARNIKKYNFPKKLSPQDAAAMVTEAQQAAIRAGSHRLFHQLDINGLSETEQKVFLEKHITSPEFLRGQHPKGLLISDDQNISVMLNEEDHIRIQSVQAGEKLSEALELANQVDDLIEESLEFAYHNEYGYLTACPTNVGTGLRASFMIHLPCLDTTGQLKNLIPHITKFGITIRGIYGEGTQPMGSIYQISNQRTLGKSEEDIIQDLQNVTKNVIEHENQARDNFLKSRLNYLEDRVHRAYGILSHSRMITAEEAMHLLSDIRLGYLANILQKPRPKMQIYQIMIEIQPGHLQRLAGREMQNEERDAQRAEKLREIFS
ncbi:MAG: protein arginine kinase [Defluviitaleaceae bacterium]|nr:protein arginine kinase [Defluviitaleaceae bacterium]